MKETYKILSGKYDTNVVPNLETTGIQATRGNDLRIFKTRFKYDLRKFYFTNRVVMLGIVCQIGLLWLTVLIPFSHLCGSSRGSLRFYNRREPQKPQIYRQMNRAFT